MSVNVAHTDFTDATTLFADLAAANAMLDGLTVPDATTSTDGVMKMSAHLTDIIEIDNDGGGSTPITAGASVSSDENTIPNIGAAYDVAEMNAAFKMIAEKINLLTYRLEQAGIMSSS